jgi:preprotein translocase subunit SecG
MYALVMFVHVAVCIFLIIVVLLQSGKAADLAGAFGGMGSQTAFGPRGSATLLSRATTFSAVAFMVTSLTLSILATRNAGLGTTVLDTSPQKAVPGAPKAPAPSPVPQSAPVPIQIPVNPQPTNNPNEMHIDLKDLKVPPQAQPPAQAPPPASKK